MNYVRDVLMKKILMGNNLYWYDKDGTEWLIEYMDDYYLLNCIRLIKRKIREDDDYLPPPVFYELLAEYNERCEDSGNRSLLPYKEWVNTNTDIKKDY